VVVVGLALQAAGFALLARAALPLPQAVSALALLGAGEAFAMTPMLADLLDAPPFAASADVAGAVDSLSALVTACFALGQFVGPCGGALLAGAVGFSPTCGALALAVGANGGWLWRLAAAREQQARTGAAAASAASEF
jgi:hypothetical protein